MNASKTIKLMFMNEIKSERFHRAWRVSIYIYFVNWNSYQIKALITLDYLSSFVVFLFIFRCLTSFERENRRLLVPTWSRKKNSTPEPVRQRDLSDKPAIASQFMYFNSYIFSVELFVSFHFILLRKRIALCWLSTHSS